MFGPVETGTERRGSYRRLGGAAREYRDKDCLLAAGMGPDRCGSVKCHPNITARQGTGRTAGVKCKASST